MYIYIHMYVIWIITMNTVFFWKYSLDMLMNIYIYVYSCVSLGCQTVASPLAHWSTERSCVMTKSEESEYLKTKLQYYCWWKKSCTSWYGECPIIYRVLYIPGGAGFLPSTVVTYTYASNLINLISPRISLWSLGNFFQKSRGVSPGLTFEWRKPGTGGGREIGCKDDWGMKLAKALIL